MLVHAAPPNPKEIFDAVIDLLCPQPFDNPRSLHWRTQRILTHLEYCFRQHNTTCMYVLMLQHFFRN